MSSYLEDKISALLKKSDKDWNTLLHYVVGTDNEDFVRQLIAAGCDVNQKNKDGNPPLACAIEYGQLGMVKILLDAGAIFDNTYFKDANGPLHIAADMGNLNVVQLLIKMGANINACNKSLQTPLHLANECCYRDKADDYLEIIKALFFCGANINVEDGRGRTPLGMAIVMGFHAGFKLMLSMGAKIVNAINFHYLHKAIVFDHFDILEYLVEFGHADLRVVDRSSNTCLHIAASKSKSKIVEFLLQKGASTNAVNNDGLDTLCYALTQWSRASNDVFHNSNNDHNKDLEEGLHRECHLEKRRCFDLLIKHGADVNHVTENQLTPLYIILSNYRFHSDYVRVLLKRGAIFDFEHPIVENVMSDQNGSKFSQLLVRQVAMFAAQNRTDGPSNFDLNKLNMKLLKFYAQCRDELDWMCANKISNTKVSFFNLLTNQCVLPRKLDIENTFEVFDVADNFPIYSDLLFDRLK